MRSRKSSKKRTQLVVQMKKAVGLVATITGSRTAMVVCRTLVLEEPTLVYKRIIIHKKLASRSSSKPLLQK